MRSQFNRNNTRSAKRSPAEIRQIRQEYADGASQASLARKWQYSIGQIGRIVRGESWQAYDNPAAGAIVLEPAAAMPSDAELAASAARVFDTVLAQQMDPKVAAYLGIGADEPKPVYVPPMLNESPEIIAARRAQSDAEQQAKCAERSGYPLVEVQRLWSACGGDRVMIGKLINQLKNTSAEQKMQNEIDFLSKGDSL